MPEEPRSAENSEYDMKVNYFILFYFILFIRTLLRMTGRFLMTFFVVDPIDWQEW